MDGKWKRVTDIKEIGDKTDKVETMEFPEYISSNCNLTTCHYNKDGKCTNDEKRLSPSELLMHLSDGIGDTEKLKKFGIEVDFSKFEDDGK